MCSNIQINYGSRISLTLSDNSLFSCFIWSTSPIMCLNSAFFLSRHFLADFRFYISLQAIDEIRICSQFNNSHNVDVIKQRQSNPSSIFWLFQSFWPWNRLRRSWPGSILTFLSRRIIAYLFSRRASVSSWSLNSFVFIWIRLSSLSSYDPDTSWRGASSLLV